MWRFKVLEFVKWFVAITISLVLFFAVAFLNATAFPLIGVKEYYLYSPSSQAQIKREVGILDLPFLRGESVRVTCQTDGVLEVVLAQYSASIVKVEEFCDGVSYYCYSPKLKKGIVIDGVMINLQIAVRGEEVVMGTPIIFGGY